MQPQTRSIIIVAWCLLAASTGAGEPIEVLSAEVTVDFSRDVRPILSDHCFACHGPDENHRQADLRLDVPNGISGIVEAGEADSSELVLRILADDPDQLMPPPDYQKPLSEKQIRILQSWINGGARVRNHWSFIAPQKQPLPRDVEHPIDYFVDRKLRSIGLAANPQATDRALLRRLCLDLTGLPPTRTQIQALGSDEWKIDKWIDELLASPAFGQHFGRYWLDLVRYGDTHGLHLDNYREMWPYRDWVIEAFNQNMPFDQFIIEQLAGDLLPNATLSQKIASGYNRLNVTTSEGGSIYDEVFARNVIDRTDAFGTVFLGLTTQCAVCHEHKFDPISQQDYYSLFAFFNSLDGRALDGNKKDPAPVVRVPSQHQSTQLAELDRQIEQIQQEMDGSIESVDAAQREWEVSLISRTADSSSSDANVATPSSDQQIRLSPIHTLGPFSVESEGPGFYRTFGSETKAFDAKQSFQYGDKTFRWQRQDSWSPVSICELPVDDEAVAVNLIHQGFESPEKQSIDLLLGSSDGHVVFLNNKRIAESKQVGPIEPLSKAYKLDLKKGRNDLYIRTVSQSRPAQIAFAFRSSSIPLPSGIVELAKQAPDRRTPQQSASLRRYFRDIVCKHPDWLVLKDLLGGAQDTKKKLQEAIPTTLVWKELDQPRPANILIRGQYDRPGKTVSRGVPRFLAPDGSKFAKRSSRLGTLAGRQRASAHCPRGRQSILANHFWYGNRSIQ